MPSNSVHDTLLREVTPARRQRGSGHLVVWLRQPVFIGRSAMAEPSPACKLVSGGVDRRQHLSFTGIRKAAGGLPGSEPHSGNPTVWDRRGACGNVGYGLG